MTTETRTTVQLSDIQAIEFECKKCHAKAVFKIASFEGPPLHCISCGQPPELSGAWFGANSEERTRIADLGRIIRQLARFSDHAETKFTVRLEVSGVSASRAGDRA